MRLTDASTGICASARMFAHRAAHVGQNRTARPVAGQKRGNQGPKLPTFATFLQQGQRVCYKRTMRGLRGWIDEKMRRRSRRGPNDSESTGKSGQELPQNQPAPLRPAYPDAPAPKPAAEAVADPPAAPIAAPSEKQRSAAPEKKVVVETQPDSLANFPLEPEERLAQRATRLYVVLAIGLPGSGKTTQGKRRGVTSLSSDMLRSILFDDITEQRYQGLVFSTLRSLAARPSHRQDVPWNYGDATQPEPARAPASGSRWPRASAMRSTPFYSTCRLELSAWSATPSATARSPTR